jgi:hypothetical protein
MKKIILMAMTLGLLMSGCYNKNRINPRDQVYNFKDAVDTSSIQDQEQFEKDSNECSEIAYARYKRSKRSKAAYELGAGPMISAVTEEAVPTSPVASPMVNALQVFKRCMKNKGYSFQN